MDLLSPCSTMKYIVFSKNLRRMRYGVKQKSGMYITEKKSDATIFADRDMAEDFAEEISDIHGKIGMKFEVMEVEK